MVSKKKGEVWTVDKNWLEDDKNKDDNTKTNDVLAVCSTIK